ncbi:terpene synthase [Plantactinospora sp. S1510]|uniref:Terpene synthase n=1 Tax=Plantactinospora alkalitolerans TaxID=2789879 RepID=A0ABS0GR54_9ACTN|nr:terpene synthase [Plantactinospora alkalitolerans]MBF9128499.1 terpene synthase [Plantactinospora alkalitolerans]
MYGDDAWVDELRCPIPARICPYADEVQDWLGDWAERVGGPLDPEARVRLARGGVARYAGRLYPDATEADLQVLAALFTWFFLLDDACDAARRPRPAEVAALCDGVLRLLRTQPVTAAGTRSAHQPPAIPGTRSPNRPAARLTSPPATRSANQPAPRPEVFDGPLRRMLADAWQIPYHRMAAPWRDRFVDAVAHHLRGVVVEATNKATGRLPTVAEYVALRRATSAAYVSYALIEFATGRPVPDAVYHHPAVREVAATANDLLSWFNDLLSLDRDAATSGGHNLVLAVARENGIPVEEAIPVVVRRWQGSMRRFVELRDAVPSFGPALDGPLREYLAGVANSVRGTMDWSMESGRYRATLRATPPPGAVVRAEKLPGSA